MNGHADRLTDREKEVLFLIASGLSTKKVADELSIAVKTVEAHRFRMMGKTGRHSIPMLVNLALELGMELPLLNVPNVLATRREYEVIRLVAMGFSNKEVGDRLGVSNRTADSHRTRVMKKLGIHGVGNLTRYAYKMGWVTNVGGRPELAPEPVQELAQREL